MYLATDRYIFLKLVKCLEKVEKWTESCEFVSGMIRDKTMSDKLICFLDNNKQLTLSIDL